MAGDWGAGSAGSLQGGASSMFVLMTVLDLLLDFFLDDSLVSSLLCSLVMVP
jgi:hypothetical protein